MKITKVFAQEVLDSRGFPTVEAEVTLENGMKASAMVPSGASTGSHEALELRDGDTKRYMGKGTLKAVQNVNDIISKIVVGLDSSDQVGIDKAMILKDGTETKANLGANAILAVSMAVARVTAMSLNIPLYEYISKLFSKNQTSYTLPVPMMNVLNGGKHALGSSDMQEYMIMPIGAPNVSEAIRYGSEVFHTLGKILKKKGHQTTVGDEGGYAPKLSSNEEPLQLIVEAITEAGYVPGKDIGIALDPASTEFYQDGKYNLAVEGKMLTSDEMIERYSEWVSKYPIVSIEDGLSEDDWDGWVKLVQTLGDKVQLVGDDLFVTNVQRLQKGIELKAANAILIKLNQIGSVTETIDAMKLAEKSSMHAVVSHRSGETEDAFIADFVVGAGNGQIKTGSLSRSERIAKYNQLMRIERSLQSNAKFGSLK